MDEYFFDWRSGKVNVLKNHQPKEDQVVFISLDEFLDTLTEPSIVVGETTFESYLLETRNRVIQRFVDEGHKLLSSPNRLTGRHRRRLGYSDEDKTDEIDVHVIRDEYYNTNTFMKTPVKVNPDDPFIQIRIDANRELMILRSTLVRVPLKSGNGYKKNPEKAKDIWAQEIITKLPTYGTLDDETAKALGNGTEYANVIIAAIGVCAKFATTRKEFDRLSGLYHHGYPSQIRSDLHYHGWWNPRKRELNKMLGYKTTPQEVINDPTYKKEFRNYRKALRNLWRYMKDNNIVE